MSLLQFLIDHRSQILDLSEKKTIELAALRPISDELRKGLPIFLDQLVSVLEKSQMVVSFGDESKILNTSGFHGKEMLRLGYTLSHVVHAYGAMCQAITEVASILHAPMTALEFHNLNRCLDIAIAGAVSEFETLRNHETIEREVQHMGALAHELRNALNRATISSEMIAKGLVGIGGSTSKVLAFSLAEMHRLISRSLSEVRLRADSEIHEEYFFVMELINQLVVTAEIEAAIKQQTLVVQIDPDLSVKTDRHLLFAAVGNLVHNAMKFTRHQGRIKITARAEGEMAILEVEDECGGIPPEQFDSLFKPFKQLGQDRSGLGMGLSIVLKTIAKCNGSIECQNVPGGCAFKITLPKKSAASPSPTPVV